MATPGDRLRHSYTIDTMPFFKPVPGRGRDFWAVSPPAGYEAAMAYGARLACMLLRLEPERADMAGGRPFLFESVLRWIVLDQIGHGIGSVGARGAVLGFWGVIGGLIAGLVESHPGGGPALATALEARLTELDSRTRTALVSLYGEAAVADWEAGHEDEH